MPLNRRGKYGSTVLVQCILCTSCALNVTSVRRMRLLRGCVGHGNIGEVILANGFDRPGVYHTFISGARRATYRNRLTNRQRLQSLGYTLLLLRS